MININTSDTISKAKELSNIANSMSNCTQTISTQRTESQGFWQGSCGDMYRTKLNKINSSISERAKKIGKLADAVESSARNYQRIESMFSNK